MQLKNKPESMLTFNKLILPLVFVFAVYYITQDFLLYLNALGEPDFLSAKFWFDPMVMHKIGEALILIPFFLVLMILKFAGTENAEKLLKRIMFLTVVGGVMNIAAWVSFKGVSDVQTWMMVMSFLGILAIPLAKLFIRVQAKTEAEKGK